MLNLLTTAKRALIGFIGIVAFIFFLVSFSVCVGTFLGYSLTMHKYGTVIETEIK